MQAKLVTFSGSVQGVGFRYTTIRIAKNYDVTGYVRNTYDGKVELLAQGKALEVEHFIEDVCQSFEGYIRSKKVENVDYAPMYQGFEITF